MCKSSVIVPVFNQAALTARCVRVVLESGAGEVIVVDDGSTDHTLEILAGFGDAITAFAHPENRGFAAACNTGAFLSTSQYLVFLNNDTIPQSGWLTALEDYADSHPNASVVGSKLIYPDQRVQHAGVVVCQDRYPRHVYSGFPAEHPAVNKSRRFQIVTAACMLVRRSVFEKTGGFDTAFRNGFEDVDLCLRLGKQGYEIHFCAESVLQHLESVSPGRFKYDRQNVDLYRERWLERVQPDDLSYYIQDGLLSLNYEGGYPFRLQVTPLLAVLDGPDRETKAENTLRELTRRVGELSRDNTRLALELGTRMEISPELRYRNFRRRLSEVIQELVPEGATLLVISKGDGVLLDFAGRTGWHFPQTAFGAYSGHHPADGPEAIALLEQMRLAGGEFLVIPSIYHWWLDHYTAFREHLDSRYERLSSPEDVCFIYDLRPIRAKQLSPCELTEIE